METPETMQNEVIDAPQPLADGIEMTAPAETATRDAGEEAVQEPAPGAAVAVAEAEAEVPASPAGLLSAQEVERLVAEAYRKGRNESIAELMASPSMFEPEAPRPAPAAAESHDFLAHRRKSIWDL